MSVALGRLIQFDERSRQYPVRSLIEAAPKRPVRSYTWRCSQNLDQGQEGACVGFSWAHELVARPHENLTLTNEKSREIYHLAKTLDPWEGESYEGTSVLAGVKAAMQLFPSSFGSYRWCFNLQDLLQTVSYVGPVVIGVNWYSGMVTPDKNGIIRPTGLILGGHATLIQGISLPRKLARIHNSWGKDWGIDGDCFISFDDLEKLLYEQGEACVAIKNKIAPAIKK